jgi:putative peptidoglycan lipid II flippase
MHAVMVAAGILLSRALGLVREALKARYLGATGSIAADAFNAAFRIPNILNNLLGEGSLSASFIPVYSRLLAKGDPKEADRVAGAVGAFLGLISAGLVLLGVLSAPVLVAVIAGGFEGERRALAVQLTRILFPGAALFVFGAWCLGILNSHRRFFLSYAANGVWNVAMIAALVIYRHETSAVLAEKLAWGSVIGAALLFLIQLPVVMRVAPAVRLNLGRGSDAVRTVMKNFVPAFVSRGVVQISATIDQYIASFLGLGAVSLLFYAQTITTLPVSLFGMSISASELPEMSSTTGDEAAVAAHVRTRISASLRRIAYFIVPSAAAFILLGDVIAGAVFQGGRFTATDTRFTWAILAAASVGLLASTLGRMYSTGFFALHDTRTPLRFAILRVTLSSVIGYVVATQLPARLGIASQWGAAALTLTSGLAGWVEFTLLRSRLNARIGATGVPLGLLATLWGAAIAAGAAGYGLKLALPDAHLILRGAIVLGVFGAVYVGLTLAIGVAEARSFADSARKRLKRS